MPGRFNPNSPLCWVGMAYFWLLGKQQELATAVVLNTGFAHVLVVGNQSII